MFKKSILILFTILLYSNILVAQEKFIKVISPNGGENLFVGERYGISWNLENVERVSIFYSISENSEWELIAKGVYGELGHFSWKTPNIYTKSLKIKIVSDNDNNIYDTSDGESKIESKLSKLSSTNSVLKIMPLGNSITFDNRKNDTRAVENKIGYRYPLYSLLKNAGYNFSFIGSEHAGSNFFFPDISYDNNAGFPGIYDFELNNLLESGILSLSINGRLDTLTTGPYLNEYDPDIILLHIGTNGNDQVGGTSALDVEAILDKIDNFEMSNNKEVVVFLARIINRVPNQTYVTTFNNNVVNMALDRMNNPLNDAYPDNIVIVDMQNIDGYNYSISPDPNGSPGDMNDQLHPNDKGYTKLAETWYNSLQSYLGNPPVFISQPKSVYAFAGESIQFNISVSGTKPMSYQWKKNGFDIAGKNDSILYIDNISLSDNESYFTCEVSNSASVVESNEAVLYVNNEDQRVTAGIQAFYTFNEGTGVLIHDSSNVGSLVDLTINTPSNVNWIPAGLEITSGSSISANSNPAKLYNSLTNSNEMTMEVWLKPSSEVQDGPARIITYSKTKYERNFSLMQDLNKYEFRTRTLLTDNNGNPSLFTTPGVTKNELTHLVYTLNSQDTAKLFLNGKLEASMYLTGGFSNWDPSFSFGIANEFTDSKPWLGTFYLVAIYDRALGENEVTHNYSKGVKGLTNIIPPNNLIANLSGDGNIELNWNDNGDNEMGYIIWKKSSMDTTFAKFDTVTANQINYLDSQIGEGKKYSYYITAYNNFGQSSNSNLANIITPLSRPINLIGTLNNENNVELNWEDGSTSESGFIIEAKANSQDSIYYIIDSVNSNTTNYTDVNPKYYSPCTYRVYAFTPDTISDFSNQISIDVVGIDENEMSIPTKFELKQNYPNPFNPSTIIEYTLPQEATVNLTIYNTLGQKVVNLVNEKKSLGYHEVTFDASNLNSGVYYYVLKAVIHNKAFHFREVKKLLFIK